MNGQMRHAILTAILIGAALLMSESARAQKSTEDPPGDPITVIGTDGKVMVSHDGGVTWETVTLEPPDRRELERQLGRPLAPAQELSIGKIQVNPNPTSGTTQLSYELTRPGTVTVIVSDARGVIVMRSEEGMREVGIHAAALDASRLSNGAYHCQVFRDNTAAGQGTVIVARY